LKYIKLKDDAKSNNLNVLVLFLLKGTPIIDFKNELPYSNEDNGYMKWSNSLDTNCDFSTNKSQTAKFTNCDGSIQESFANGVGQSKAKAISYLTVLREKPSFQWGEFVESTKQNDGIVSFLRHAEGFPKYLVAICTKRSTFDFTKRHDIENNAKVVFFYSNEGKHNDDFTVNKNVTTDSIKLEKGELLVLELN
jgi:hypothetical protein